MLSFVDPAAAAPGKSATAPAASESERGAAPRSDDRPEIPLEAVEKARFAPGPRRLAEALPGVWLTPAS